MWNLWSVREARMANGLVKGHVYTITKALVLDVRGIDFS